MTDPKIYWCGYCGRGYTGVADLKNIVHDTGERWHVCNRCARELSLTVTEFEPFDEEIQFDHASKSVRTPNQRARGRETSKSGSMCDILRSHHEILSDDPEHLSTDFLKALIQGNERGRHNE